MTLKILGLTVDVLDVSTAPHESIVNSLTRNDIIFVGGGNTFYLLQELRRSEADKIYNSRLDLKIITDKQVIQVEDERIKIL